ncbi:permease [Paraburkholderia hospita]|uniref:Permease n=1 Tax=Paraburkholderia hospita TaxID=169430 RepID=A0ABN0FEH5_9BURK|nr:permease [Paraburkholderia hospita]
MLLAIVGLFYVKWFPYYNRAFTAASTHSIGASILMGKASSPPAPSWSAALAYALAYGKAIWQAMVLGLLLGSAVQALLPAHWVARLLGKTGFGSVAAGGLLALPGMMCTCCAAPRRRRAAGAAGFAGRCDRVLARQFGPQPRDARVHGLRARLALGRVAARARHRDGVRPRLSGEPPRDTHGSASGRRAPGRTGRRAA